MTTNGGPHVVICFDGSEGSLAAVHAAARIFSGARTTIVHAWQTSLPYGGVDYNSTMDYGGQVMLPPDVQHDLDQKVEEQASNVAEFGAKEARAAGLVATGSSREAIGSVWRTLLASAEELDADVLVVGTRGHGEFRALVLGSTSTALSHHSTRPLLVVPSTQAD